MSGDVLAFPHMTLNTGLIPPYMLLPEGTHTSTCWYF